MSSENLIEKVGRKSEEDGEWRERAGGGESVEKNLEKMKWDKRNYTKTR